jgi:putative copper resistance protein D
MTLEAGLVVSRFVHFTCAIILFGSAFFAVCSPPSDNRSERLTRPLAAVLLAAALCAVLSGLAWFLFTVGNMSGTLADAFDGEALWTVLWDTGFGRVWAARVAVMLLIVGMIWLGIASC